MQNSERLVDTAQVLLTGYDIGLSRGWREEDRKWRREDMDWREKEQRCLQLDYAFMQQERQWRQADVEQSHLNNARYLWQKFVAKNQREVEEKAGQLKAISSLSALLAGFAMVAFLEMQFTFDHPQQVPQYRVVLPLHGLTTGTTVAVEMACVVMCTLMLSSVLRTGHSFVSEEEEAEFMLNCKAFVTGYKPHDRPPAPARSFSAHWNGTMERQWRHAVLLFSAGLPLFCTQLALASWVKFWQSPTAAVVVSVVMALTILLLLLLQCVWKHHLLQRSQHQGGDRYQHAPMGLPFDWHLKPQAPDLWRPASPRSSQDDAAAAGGRHDQQCGGQEEAVRSDTHPAGLRCTPADVRDPSMAELLRANTAGRDVSRSNVPDLQQQWQQQWQRQDPVSPGSLLSWTLPAQVALLVLHGLRHATAWLSRSWLMPPSPPAAPHPAPTGSFHAADSASEADEHHAL